MPYIAGGYNQRAAPKQIVGCSERMTHLEQLPPFSSRVQFCTVAAYFAPMTAAVQTLENSIVGACSSSRHRVPDWHRNLEMPVPLRWELSTSRNGSPSSGQQSHYHGTQSGCAFLALNDVGCRVEHRTMTRQEDPLKSPRINR